MLTVRRIITWAMAIVALVGVASPIRSATGSRQASFIYGEDKPYDAEVEYLESSLTELMFIDTGIVPDINCRIICKYQRQGSATGDGIGNYKGLFGGNYDGDVNHLCYGVYSHGPWNTRFDFHQKLYHGNLVDYTVGITDKALQVLEMDSSTISVNGIVQTTSMTISGIESKLPMRLFSGDDEYANWCKIWYFAIERDGVALIYLIPVRKGNIGFMYDMVTGGLFGNQGNGQFIIGPDL